MADNKKNRGEPDRSLVSQQPWEVRHLVEKHEMPTPLVKKIIEQVGPSRDKVEKKLEDMKRNRKG